MENNVESMKKELYSTDMNEINEGNIHNSNPPKYKSGLFGKIMRYAVLSGAMLLGAYTQPANAQAQSTLPATSPRAQVVQTTNDRSTSASSTLFERFCMRGVVYDGSLKDVETGEGVGGEKITLNHGPTGKTSNSISLFPTNNEYEIAFVDFLKKVLPDYYLKWNGRYGLFVPTCAVPNPLDAESELSILSGKNYNFNRKEIGLGTQSKHLADVPLIKRYVEVLPDGTGIRQPDGSLIIAEPGTTVDSLFLAKYHLGIFDQFGNRLKTDERRGGWKYPIAIWLDRNNPLAINPDGLNLSYVVDAAINGWETAAGVDIFYEIYQDPYLSDISGTKVAYIDNPIAQTGRVRGVVSEDDENGIGVYKKMRLELNRYAGIGSEPIEQSGLAELYKHEVGHLLGLVLHSPWENQKMSTNYYNVPISPAEAKIIRLFVKLPFGYDFAQQTQ